MSFPASSSRCLTLLAKSAFSNSSRQSVYTLSPSTSSMAQCPFKHEAAPSTHVDEVLQGCSEDEIKDYSEMPGPRGIPLIGNALAYSKFGPYKLEKILDSRMAYMKKYGKVYREKLGAMEMVHIFDPSDIAAMFREEGEHPSRGKIANIELTYLKRNNKLVGFAFRDGPEWARQRGYIQRLMMHPTAATRYLNWQIPVAQDFVSYISSHRNSDGIVPNLYQDLFKYTMESIGAVCFGDRIGAFDESPGSDAERLSGAISETFFCFRNCMFAFPWYQYFRTPLYRRFERAANLMREIMGKHVDRIGMQIQKKALALKLAPSSSLSASSLSGCPFGGVFDPKIEVEDRSVYELLMIDNRVEKELADNLVMALFRTGIDSTGNSLAFFLYNLASNPDKQEELHKEICEVLPNGQPPSPSTFKKMPYLKASLRESFRLNFPVFGGSGRVMPQDTRFGNYKVPKGVFIFANIAAMSRMEDYFPQPLKYHPERWLRDERASLGPIWEQDSGFLSLPFSHGLRACPGKRYAEQGLYLAAIAVLQHFKLSYEEPDPIGMIHMPFTIPDRPLRIKFTPRRAS